MPGSGVDVVYVGLIVLEGQGTRPFKDEVVYAVTVAGVMMTVVG